LTWVDGQPQDAVPVTDRGLHYGDGLFETVLIDRGRAPAWEWHLERLSRGCRVLRLPAPPIAALEADRDGLCALGPSQAVLKIILTVGGEGRGYARPRPCAWRRILSLMPAPEWPLAEYRAGIRVRWCRQLWFPDPTLSGIKHLNRLTQVRARAEWDDPHIAEGLLRDPEGNVVGGTMSNLFVVRDGVLLTPDLARCGVTGTLRAQVMAIAAAQGRPVRETTLSIQDCLEADELFLCNAIRGIRPIRALGARSFRAGTMTRMLQGQIGPPWPSPDTEATA
jgi:4-amino-4-deoxychorismate lyase